jgi:hypothetical protein
MKVRIAMLAAATMLFGSLAMSEDNPKKVPTPSVSGSYILQTMHFCQAEIGNTSNGVVMLNSGDSNYNVATVYFSPTAITSTGTTGTATVSGLSADGSPLLLGGLLSGNVPMTPSSNQQTFTYTNTSTSFTINSGAITYNAYYASVEKEERYSPVRGLWRVGASGLCDHRDGHSSIEIERR